MGVLIGILKILGIAVLSILCIALLLFVIILFVPVRYEVCGRYPSKPFVSARISYLLHIFRIKVDYDGQDACFEIRIFAFKLSLGDSKKSGKDGDSQSNKKAKRTKKKQTESSKQSSKEDSPAGRNTSKEKRKQRQSSVSDTKEKKETEEKTGIQKIADAFRKFRNLSSDVHHQNAVRHIITEVKILLQKILPKDIKGYVNYSLWSPDYTGYLLGFLSQLPIVYTDGFTMYADFESDDAYFDGDLSLKGKLQVFPVALAAIRLWKDREVRRLFYKLRKGK